jgi:hypothetical protein
VSEAPPPWRRERPELEAWLERTEEVLKAYRASVPQGVSESS